MTDESIYRRVVEQTPDAVILADEAGVVRLWNRAAETLFGHAAEEAIGKSLDIIIPERLRAAHWAGFNHALSTGHEKYVGQVLTTRSVHKDGRTLYVDLAFALLREGDGRIAGALATARDVTSRYLEQRALRSRLADLEKQGGGER